MNPFPTRLTHWQTTSIVCVIWLIAAILSSPVYIYSDIDNFLFSNGEPRVVCYQKWPDGHVYMSDIDYWYNGGVLLITYVVPLMTMGICYLRVGLKLWGATPIGESYSGAQMANMESKRKIVKMMIIVITIFGICWLPYHLYFVHYQHDQEFVNSRNVEYKFLIAYWMAMSNSMKNPFIYCWLNKRPSSRSPSLGVIVPDSSRESICTSSTPLDLQSLSASPARTVSCHHPPITSHLDTDTNCVIMRDRR